MSRKKRQPPSNARARNTASKSGNRAELRRAERAKSRKAVAKLLDAVEPAGTAGLRRERLEQLARAVEQNIRVYWVRDGLDLRELSLPVAEEFLPTASSPVPSAASARREDAPRNPASLPAEGSSRVAPPKRAEFLLYLFLPPEQRETVPGDLLEIFTERIVPKFGIGHARVWYWWQVVRSIWPLFGSRVVRLVKWGFLAKAADHLWRRFMA